MASPSISYAQFEEICGPQLAGSGVPLELWGIIFDKLRHNVMDAGEAFQLARVAGDDEDEEDDAKGEIVLVASSNHVAKENAWLVDHAWTFRVRDARKQLEENATLFARVSTMLTGAEGAPLDDVYNRLWFKASTYRIATEDSLDEECCWYLMDEVGTALQHVEQEAEGNCRVVPIFYPPAGFALSIIWLTKDVEAEDMLYFCDALERSRCPGILRLSHSLMSSSSNEEELEDVSAQLRAAFDMYQTEILGMKGEFENEQQSRVSRGAPHKVLVLPAKEACGRPVRVACDLQEVIDNLRLSDVAQGEENRRWEFTPDMQQADIIWLAQYQEDLRDAYRGALFVSQMGIENILCHKEKLQRLVRRVYGSPKWLPVTYDAMSEMHLFAGDYLTRRQRNLNNLWIVKPHCMARSMDMVVSDSLPLLLRQSETGPKIICKYIERPCLFRKRKFDLRLIVAVQSLHPSLNIYLFDKVWPRFALEEYSLTELDVYEKHWTVMNYANPDKMINLKNDDFVVEFDAEHGEGKWASALEKIRQMLVELFQAVAQWTTTGKQTATIYGLDVMLTDELEPMLLEATFAPDCHRACVQYPTFFSDVFATLFEGRPSHFTPLVVMSVEQEVAVLPSDAGVQRNID